MELHPHALNFLCRLCGGRRSKYSHKKFELKRKMENVCDIDVSTDATLHNGHSLTLFCIRMSVIFFFCNSEVMTSFPQSLVLDSQPHFGFTPSNFLKLYNFLINQRIFMKIVAKCSCF